MNKTWLAMALLALAFAALLYGILHLISMASSEPVEPCISSSEQAKVLALTTAAIDQAFQEHVAHLFTVWLKDPGPEPARARNGMKIGIDARRRAMVYAHSWNPPFCKE